VKLEHLYVHVPFCARRCVYCDFSIAVRDVVPVGDYLSAVDGELAARHGAASFRLKTLYFGGGTPSKLGASGVAALMDLIRQHADLAADAEVTLEANPEDVTEANALAWRQAGINRVSLGVQSFDDAVLRWMHRTHDSETARSAVAALRAAGIPNMSIDLIFATPPNVERQWRRDLDAALALDVPHLSVYGLTIEPRTPLGRWIARRDTVAAEEDAFAAEFLAAHNMLTQGGYGHYEVSNYARAGHESRHNRAYWMRSPYAGIGPSAHEFDGTQRRWNLEAYVAWQTIAVGRKDPVEGREELGAEQVVAEEVYLGLRTDRGVRLGEPEVSSVAPWVDSGWARVDRDVVRLTALGWLRLDSLAAALTHVRSRY
jgi:oxygen-independent coproporphyrinogen-3 oxidase